MYIYIYINAIRKIMTPPFTTWLCGNSRTWAHDAQLQHCTSCAEMLYFTRLTSVRFKHFVCRGSLRPLTEYTYIDRCGHE